MVNPKKRPAILRSGCDLLKKRRGSRKKIEKYKLFSGNKSHTAPESDCRRFVEKAIAPANVAELGHV